ncbi:phytanoyl-CoA dioxygenase family protein [Alteromonas oceani]|uniref:Phytanoyl-CoA dioxygenase family protein n=1 Tax=Alteromonas oceani TaxID=2071609 RepID=A0ABV7K3N7_9ALTE|nr:phytanoyl-CoA dioxygenase family protein [Alteromonas oceani]
MFTENGFESVNNFATTEEVLSLREAVSKLSQPSRSGGVRNIERKSRFINSFANSERVLKLVASHIGGKPILARAIYFNKTPDQNWLVAWHQDKTTAVSKKITCTSWQNWTIKDGVNHAQPPMEVFTKMLTVRLHLDSTDQTNGCLKVIPGSHLLGVLPQAEILAHSGPEQSCYCKANAGDALLMHPLLIHASSKATMPTARRIIHMEYSSHELPESAKWA